MLWNKKIADAPKQAIRFNGNSRAILEIEGTDYVFDENGNLIDGDGNIVKLEWDDDNGNAS